MTTLRFKPVPPAPDDLAVVETASDAVPLVPGTEADCCGRIQSALGLAARDDARTWLTFLRALGVVRETDAGFARVREGGGSTTERDTLAAAFRERVFGAREVLAALEESDEPLTTDETFDAVRGMVPEWERRRDPAGWADRWRERVARLLDWATLLGLAERVADGYRDAAVERDDSD